MARADFSVVVAAAAAAAGGADAAAAHLPRASLHRRSAAPVRCLCTPHTTARPRPPSTLAAVNTFSSMRIYAYIRPR
jgi:hypothetical protein